MDVLKEYDIEFIKLKLGDHEFEYHLGEQFFKAFNSSLTANDISVRLNFHKSENMFTLNFEFEGDISTECDRCLSAIDLPITGEERVLVKITEFPKENEDDLIYLTPGDYKFNIAQHLFDFVSLSLPIKKTCDDVGKTCDENVTKNITSMIDFSTTEDELPERETDEEIE